VSAIKTLILSADAESRYLSPGELEQIKCFTISGERRLRLAKTLTECRERIVKQAGNLLFQLRPSLVSPGGNAYGEEMTAICLRDMDYYLRLITYGVAAGETTPIQEIGVIGVRQMYSSLGTPIDAVVESIRAMKDAMTTLMPGDDAREVGAYFDYLINALQ
jgi:allophycocyanin alpha subunit